MTRRLLLVFACLLLLAPPVSAQLGSGDQIVILGGGYGWGKLTGTDLTLDGGIVGLSLDQMQKAPWSFSISFGYTRLTNDKDTLGVNHRTVTSWPLSAGAKVWFGQSKVQGYLGAELAVYFSSLERTIPGTTESYTSYGASGWGLIAPVGVAFWISDKAFINAGYRMNWLWDSDAFENNLLHMLLLGIGFKLN